MVRFKNRYIVLEIAPHSKGDKQLMLKNTALSHAVQQKVQQLYGDFGVAAIKDGFDGIIVQYNDNPSTKYCNSQTKIALVKIRHGPHKFVLRAIPLINDVGGRFVKMNILYMGATMKHCFLFIRKYQEGKLEQIWSKLRTETERKEMEMVLTTLTPAMKDFKFFFKDDPNQDFVICSRYLSRLSATRIMLSLASCRWLAGKHWKPPSKRRLLRAYLQTVNVAASRVIPPPPSVLFGRAFTARSD